MWGILKPISNALNKGTDFAEGLYHRATGTPDAAARRAQNAALQSQMDYYKQQTSISESQIAQARDSQLAEKRVIEAKQIRALRRNFKPAGFLDSGSDTSGLSNTLGS